jgi:hypothetical protein
MNDIMSIRGKKITDVKMTKGSDEKEGTFNHLQLTLDDGSQVGFSSTDAEQDSISCHWHVHPVEYTIK